MGPFFSCGLQSYQVLPTPRRNSLAGHSWPRGHERVAESAESAPKALEDRLESDGDWRWMLRRV